MPAEDFITTTEVAELTGWSITSINRWTLAGHLPYVRKLPGRSGTYLFDRLVVQQRINVKSQTTGIVREPAA